MNKTTFLEGVGLALLFSLSGTFLFFLMTSLLGVNGSFHLMISTLSFGYLLYIIIRSGIKTGRVTAVSLWLVITLSSWALALPLSIFFLVQVSIIWLIRSLYFYSSALSSISDLLLMGFSIAVAIWASMHTGVLFLTLWCFFLVQSLFVFIPASFNKQVTSDDISISDNDDFDKAYKSAKQALAKLSI